MYLIDSFCTASGWSREGRLRRPGTPRVLPQRRSVVACIDFPVEDPYSLPSHLVQCHVVDSSWLDAGSMMEVLSARLLRAESARAFARGSQRQASPRRGPSFSSPALSPSIRLALASGYLDQP